MKKLLKIGEVAKQANVTVETLRYYQTENLLVPKRNTESGYRLYSEQELQKLNFILHSKKVGFSLSEIKQLLSLRTDKDQHTCEEVKSYTGNKMDEIESKIRDLEKMRQALSSLHNACCGGSESAKQCTILNSLDDPELFTSTNNETLG